MDANHRVAVIVGSLRKDSLNRKMAQALIGLAPPGLSLAIVEIGGLPHYNADFEADPPPAVTAFRAAIVKFDAVLFITPEYNRTMPGVLKNAIDVGSRPPGKSVWMSKPAAIVSMSPGAVGGFGANHNVRQALVFLNMPTMQMPEAYVGGAAALFGPDGALVSDGTREFMTKFMAAFAQWIARNAAS
jgi:chromate reductase